MHELFDTPSYTVKSSHSKFQQNNIRNLKNSNPRKYWKLINSKKKNSVTADADYLFQYFKNVNFDKTLENSSPSNTSTQNVNEEMNVPFTKNEIQNAIKSLKNNIATGVDLMLNELFRFCHI